MSESKQVEQVKNEVKDYYGKTLQQSEDLQTNACCTGDVYPDYVKKILAKIHDEVHTKYYGCGLTIPTGLSGKKVLDLGSGAGRDCYIVSSLVGPEGEVVGVDMTDEQLDVANRHIEYHREVFGFEKSNVKFLKGEIEKLDALNLPDDYFDVVISNCVINLSTDKDAVLNEVYRVLKPGGEIYFSDVYSDRRIPAELVKDPILYGECLSGALYIQDFKDLAKKVGFNDPRLVETDRITMMNAEIEKLVGDIKFYSMTFRLFKLKELENHCEDYGQEVIYSGNLEESPELFILDEGHHIKKGEKFKVCGNSFRMLNESRFKDYFQFTGNMTNHLGLFDGYAPKQTKKSGPATSCC